MLKKIDGKSRGVSLIGVMVAVAMVAIVVAMAVPAQMRSSQIRHARGCQENLSRIDGAIDAFVIENEISGSVAISMADLLAAPGAADEPWADDESTTGSGLLREVPVCPAGGSYMVGMSGEDPVCSVGANARAGYAPHVYSRAIPEVE